MQVLRISGHTGKTAAILFGLAVVFGPAQAADAPPDLSGTFWATQYHAKVPLVGGGELPLTPAGREAYEMNMAGLKDGSKVDAARKFCTPDGVPRVLSTPYPFEIVQQPPGQVLMLHELNHQIRVVALDKPLPPFADVVAYPWFNGHSVGRYEGDTLVVETIGFNVATFLDATGAPHTDELVTIERWRKTSPTELEVVVTIRDPQYYTREWQARYTYALRNDVRVEDYVCGEEHRDISRIPGIAEARAARAQ
jgi:hypothetical protein